MFSQVFQFLQSHPYIALGALQILNFLGTGAVSNLPAPTKDSTAQYVFWFKFLNWCMGNLQRASSTRLENSPNWQAAVQAHVQQMADSGLIVARSPDALTPKSTQL